MRHLAWGAALLALAGCAVVPLIPAGRVVIEATDALEAVPAEAPVPVAGYGLATLGAQELIVQYAPSAPGRRPTTGMLKRRLRSGAEVWVLDSEAALKAELEKLWADPEVLLAEPNVKLKPLVLPADPHVGHQWWVPKVNLPAAWDLAQGFGAATVTVGIVDSGVDPAHEDLAANLLPALGYDFIQRDTDPTDLTGHGTHVAGLVAALAGNGKGGVGAAPGCKLIAIRSLNEFGTIADVSDGILHAVANGARVVNLSLGTPSDSPTMRAACDTAVASGAILVAAAGNENTNQKSYPGAYEACLCVGATTPTDARASFSNYGSWVEIAAPGLDIASTLPGSLYGLMSGTSMATPIVAGAAALVRSLRPTWSAEQVESVLKSTGAPVTGFTGNAALRRLDVARALRATAPVDAAPKLAPPVAAPSSTICTISSSVNEPSRVAIAYGTAADLAGATTVALPGGSTRITFPLAALTPNTKYYYRVSARDGAGQLTQSPILSFTTAGPKFNAVTTKTGLYSASLAWSTSTGTTRTVEIGPSTTALVAVRPPTASYQTNHRVEFHNLSPNTTYHFRISGAALDGAVLTPKTGTFKTAALTARATAGGLTPTSAVVQVQSNAATTLAITYGLSKTSLGGLIRAEVPSTGHAVPIAGLKPGTAYFFQIVATDERGHAVTAPILTTTTLPVSVMELVVSEVFSTRATFACHSSVPVTVELLLGFSPDELGVAAASAAPAVHHALTVNGLPQGTTLYAQVRALDAAGNVSLSPVVNFTTEP